MDSGEWRYGQADEPRSGDAAGNRARSSPTQPPEHDGANLWSEDPRDGWATRSSWLPSVQPTGSNLYPGPAQSDPEHQAEHTPSEPWIPQPAPTSPTWGSPAPAWQPAQPSVSGPPDTAAGAAATNGAVWGQPGGWDQPPAAPKEPTTGGWGAAQWGQTGWTGAERRPPAATLPGPPVRGDSASPTSPAPTLASAPGHRSSVLSPVSPAVEDPYRRADVDAWRRTEPPARRRVADDEESGSPGYVEEPAYGPVFGYTAGWYGIPAVFYLIWLVTLDGDRQSFVGRQLAASLPWLFAAVVLSLAIAGMLRWAIAGWRALTLSFAAAVIGAGVTTIANSMVL